MQINRDRKKNKKTYLSLNPLSFKQDNIMGYSEVERFSYDLEKKKREQNRNNKQTEIERFHWLIERLQTRVGFGWLSERPRYSRNQRLLRFDVMLQHDWPIEQCLLRIKVFFGGKTKSLCFDAFIHWLIKQITKPYRNHFLWLYENRSISMASGILLYKSDGDACRLSYG